MAKSTSLSLNDRPSRLFDALAQEYLLALVARDYETLMMVRKVAIHVARARADPDFAALAASVDVDLEPRCSSN